MLMSNSMLKAFRFLFVLMLFLPHLALAQNNPDKENELEVPAIAVPKVAALAIVNHSEEEEVWRESQSILQQVWGDAGYLMEEFEIVREYQLAAKAEELNRKRIPLMLVVEIQVTNQEVLIFSRLFHPPDFSLIDSVRSGGSTSIALDNKWLFLIREFDASLESYEILEYPEPQAEELFGPDLNLDEKNRREEGLAGEEEENENSDLAEDQENNSSDEELMVSIRQGIALQGSLPFDRFTREATQGFGIGYEVVFEILPIELNLRAETGFLYLWKDSLADQALIRWQLGAGAGVPFFEETGFVLTPGIDLGLMTQIKLPARSNTNDPIGFDFSPKIAVSLDFEFFLAEDGAGLFLRPGGTLFSYQGLLGSESFVTLGYRW
jgi:hypothetical protein